MGTRVSSPINDEELVTGATLETSSPPAPTLRKRAKGYPHISWLMGENAPRTAFVRGFRARGFGFLLEKQKELHELDKQLSSIEIEYDQHSSQIDCPHDPGSTEAGNPPWKEDIRYRKLAEDFQKKYWKYLDFFDLYSRHAEPHKLRKRYLRVCQYYINEEGEHVLSQTEREIYGTQDEPSAYIEDLLAILPDRAPKFTRLFKDKVVIGVYKAILSRFKKPDRDGLFSYDNESLDFMVDSFVGVIASSLCSALIILAYFIQPPAAQLGIITSGSALVALGMCLTTGAGGKEVWVLIAAFNAVLVVFIAGDRGSQNIV
ncbi:hypothetical protein M501DRAFT_1019461 [Patellaria atrata CBS 101060]|uniref:DUF6594 domain-containing protein n=1 Tax=Patellaria atrata CBS 101060 TaxID=1346257 RepID=A0A9P4VPU4_9PEZI|nr:hypothetical protein M501DRAFT_1019461 [Patellaria atrata CBS 101060]